ncbi:hypothetical protein EK21DRAFT_78511 [Setomelanomma holmii]|uniref:Zn(2)-C6 fungal-type domain-containing protein n=1 Tax=Setomelanomma holmii TaxID=210430 RepID=A0A9P4GZY8_9PLEO|nr:hypothetical protein EK21DRAFT_78511 [Setomelanomma holmii]
MSVHSQRQRLRGKSGCLTCNLGRSRRKKCDERAPICERCDLSGRKCQWPDSGQMLDRRYASHPRSRYSANTDIPSVCHQSEEAAHTRLTIDLEVVISRHFIETYYGYLLLPNCHPDFHDGWIRDIQDLMGGDESLRYAVLANAASHIHNMDTNPGMQNLALKFYSKSIRGLSHTLVQASNPYLTNCNGLLMSIMLLYLHGCLGKGTYHDIPPHLSAATRVLSLRFFDSPRKTLQPFDCLAFESVLYQIFLTSTVHWSDPVPLSEFDVRFWMQAEQLLDQEALFPGQSRSLNSPVLGVPVALFRLAIQAKDAYQNPQKYDEVSLGTLRRETEAWEGVVLSNGMIDKLGPRNSPDTRQIYYEAAGYLYVLIISMLLEQIGQNTCADEDVGTSRNQLPHIMSRDAWQIQKALLILRRFKLDSGWYNCYIGNWPIYTLGFFLGDAEDIALIRHEMQRRWDLTKFIQSARFHEDLERAWEQRGLVSDLSSVTMADGISRDLNWSDSLSNWTSLLSVGEANDRDTLGQLGSSTTTS